MYKRIIFALMMCLIAQNVFAQINSKVGACFEKIHGLNDAAVIDELDKSYDVHMGVVRITVMLSLLFPRKPNPGEPIESVLNRDLYNDSVRRQVLHASQKGQEVALVPHWFPQWATGFPDPTWQCNEGPCREHNVIYYCLSAHGQVNPRCAQSDQSRYIPEAHVVREIFAFLARDLSPHVKYFIPSNESGLRVYWQGTTQDLVERVFRPAWEGVKSTDPSIKIVGPSEATPRSTYETLTAGAYHYIDILDFHLYDYIGRHNVLKFLEEYEWLFYRGDWSWTSRYNRVWVTEAGSTAQHENGFESQRQTTIELIHLFLSKPWIEKVLLHSVSPDNDPGSTSLLFADGSPRPVLNAVRGYLAPQQRYRQTINPEGTYLPAIQTRAGHHAFILISNRANVSIPVRINYIREDRTVHIIEKTLPSRSRTTIEPGDPAVIGENSSVVIQAIDPSYNSYILAEHATYWTPLPVENNIFWQGGRSSEGVKLSPNWYFAEGMTDGPFQFKEDYSIVNPHPFPISILVEVMFGDQSNLNYTVRLNSIGTTKIRMNPIVHSANPHGIKLSATNESGNSVGIAAERTIVWGNDGIEGHSTTGAPRLSSQWYFAEGAKGDLFNTYYTLLNPNNSPSCLTASYLGENIAARSEYHCIPARSRMTLEIPSDLPGGGYGLRITTDPNAPIVAERAMYWNTPGVLNWEGGTAVTGSPSASQKWLLTEGATGSFFQSYILLANPTSSDASVTIQFLLPDGTERSATVTVPAEQRYTIAANTVPGMENTPYSAEITSTSPIVAERVMYWAGFPWYGGHASMGTIIP